jgi:hypothetical protein
MARGPLSLGELKVWRRVDPSGFHQSDVSAQSGHAVTVDPTQIGHQQHISGLFSICFAKF